MRSWMVRVPAGELPTKEFLEKPWVPDQVDPDLIILTERILLLSWMLGMDHASHDLDLSDPAGGQLDLGLADIEIPAMPFEDAIYYLKGRVPVTKTDWKDLEEKLRFRAFTVAALSTPDNINQVREHLLKTMDGSSTSIADLWNPDLLKDAAGLGENAWYWETVYRTNIQTCYSAGKAMEFRRNHPDFIELIGVGDERQTDICESLDGTILPALDPWWDTHWPPFHFGCRTSPRGIYHAEVEVKRETDPEWPPVSARKDVGPMDGFGVNPLAQGSYWDITDTMAVRAEKFGIIKDVRNLADRLGLKSVRLAVTKLELEEAILAYTPNSGSGFLKVCAGHGSNEMEENKRVGSILADSGRTVYLLPRSDVLKSPDALIDGQLWEFKVPKRFDAKSIDGILRDAKNQANNILLDIPIEADWVAVKRGIRDRVRREPAIEKIMILSGNKVTKLERDMIVMNEWGGL